MADKARASRIFPCQDQRGNALRRCRAARRLSQLALAEEAQISARVRPPRAMVLRLAQVLALPHGTVNGLLQVAGFSGQIPAVPLASPEMAGVRQAMDRTIARHAP